MSKKKPRPRNHGKTPDQLAPYDFIQHCAKLLKARVAAGVYHDKPGLEAAITDFDPALALIEIAADPASARYAGGRERQANAILAQGAIATRQRSGRGQRACQHPDNRPAMGIRETCASGA